jgi:hypothetical protein
MNHSYKEIIRQSKTRVTIEDFDDLKECQSTFQKIFKAENNGYVFLANWL